MVDCAWSDPGKCRLGNCRYSLLNDRPHLADWDPPDVEELIAVLPSTCALDLASLGPMLLDEIATVLGLPRPLVETIELQATRKLGRIKDLRRAHWDGH